MKSRLTSILLAALIATTASTAIAQQTVILVRHAELQGAAMAEPKNLPLSEAGEARAKRLASILKDAGVGSIYVTDFARTADTAGPISRELNTEPTVLPKGDPHELVERLRRNHATQTVLLVGHTDTLPGLVKALGAPEIKIEAQDYGNIFVVTPKGSDAPPSVLRLRY